MLEASAKKTAVDRDVVLELTDAKATPEIRFSTATTDEGRYLMMRFRPTLTSPPTAPKRHWAFLFEASGARDPLVARAQVEVIRHLLTQLDPNDTFQVYAANTRTETPAEPQPPTAEAIGKAIAFLERSHLVGAFDLAKAFETIRNPGGEMMLVHVGSGFAALGDRRHEELLKKMPPARYIGVAVGRRWDRAFVKRAAEATAGHFTQINPDEPIAWRAFELFADLQAPRMLGVSVQAVDGRGPRGTRPGKTPTTELPRFSTLAETAIDGDEIVAVTPRSAPRSDHEAQCRMRQVRLARAGVRDRRQRRAARPFEQRGADRPGPARRGDYLPRQHLGAAGDRCPDSTAERPGDKNRDADRAAFRGA